MFTTAAKTRALLPTLLMDDDDLGTSTTGTNLVLTYPAYDVPTILKDGVSITAYTFERPDKITLTADAAGERFIAQVYKGITDTALEGLILTSDRVITAEFTGYDLPGAEYLEDWSSMLTAARYLILYATASEDNTARAESLEKLARDDMGSFKTDSTGTASNIIIKVNG